MKQKQKLLEGAKSCCTAALNAQWWQNVHALSALDVTSLARLSVPPSEGGWGVELPRLVHSTEPVAATVFLAGVYDQIL